jgi:hypothetical protein
MTNKHPHAEMIKAKAYNMDLVVFKKNYEEIWVELSDQSEIRIKRNLEYFVCLPQYKKECLHWLNGGEIQWSDHRFDWTDKDKYEGDKFSYGNGFMDSTTSFRIKPRKEKRWIGVFKETMISGSIYYKNTECSYSTIEELKSDVCAPNGFEGWQFIQIEIEV